MKEPQGTRGDRGTTKVCMVAPRANMEPIEAGREATGTYLEAT